MTLSCLIRSILFDLSTKTIISLKKTNMLIGIGIALLAIIFGGSDKSLLLSDVDKYVKKEIQDKDRKGIIQQESKAVAKLDKAYAKKTKKNTKKLTAMVSNQGTGLDEYEVFFTELIKYEIESSEAYIVHRITVQETLTSDEWLVMLSEASKDIKKSEKNNAKLLEEFKKGLTKSKDRLILAIPAAKVEEAEVDIIKFNEAMYAFAEGLLETNQAEDELLTNQAATRADLLKVIEVDNMRWTGLLNGFAVLHNDLAKIVPEEEWKPIAKELNKLIKI